MRQMRSLFKRSMHPLFHFEALHAGQITIIKNKQLRIRSINFWREMRHPLSVQFQFIKAD